MTEANPQSNLSPALKALRQGQKWAAQLPSSVRVAPSPAHVDHLDLMGGRVLTFPETVDPGFFDSVARSGQAIYVVDEVLFLPPGTRIWERLKASNRMFFLETLNELVLELERLESETKPLIVTVGHASLVQMIDRRHTFARESCLPPVEHLNPRYLGHVGGMEGGIFSITPPKTDWPAITLLPLHRFDRWPHVSSAEQ